MRIIQPPEWPRPKGFASAVATSGEMVFLAGVVGCRPDMTFAADDFVGQARQAFSNIATLLKAAGARPEHLVRLTWYVADLAEYRAALGEIGKAYRDSFGRHFPAMAVLGVSGFVTPEARLEIEATAVIPEP